MNINKIKISSNDIIAFVIATSAAYYSIKYLIILKIVKQLNINENATLLININRINIDYYGLTPYVLFMSMGISMAILIIINKETVTYFDKFKYKLQYSKIPITISLPIILSLIFIIFYQPVLSLIIALVGLMYFVKMKPATKFTILNISIMFTLTFLMLLAEPDINKHKKQSKNNKAIVKTQSGIIYNSQIIAASLDWILIDHQDNQIIIPISQIKQIKF